MNTVRRSIRWLVSLVLVGLLACSGPIATRDGGRPEPGERPDGQRVERLYRVQIGLYDDRSAAENQVQDAMAWWESVPAAEQPRPLEGVDDLPVDVYWKAPYYRVRIGPFVTRDRAEAVLAATRNRFPDAFIAPEVVARRRQ